MTALTRQSNASSYLQKRGLHTAAVAAGWKLDPSGSFYHVPVYLPDGTRLFWSAKYNITSEAREQFGKVNLKGKPAELHYYMLRGTVEAIAAARCISYATEAG